MDHFEKTIGQNPSSHHFPLFKIIFCQDIKNWPSKRLWTHANSKRNSWITDLLMHVCIIYIYIYINLQLKIKKQKKALKTIKFNRSGSRPFMTSKKELSVLVSNGYHPVNSCWCPRSLGPTSDKILLLSDESLLKGEDRKKILSWASDV